MGFQIPGTVRGGTIDDDNPRVPAFFLTGDADKAGSVGDNFGSFEWARGTGGCALAQPPQGGTEGQGTSHAVPVRFLVAGEKKILTLGNKVDKLRGNRYTA
jgi:hypothetical protein